MKKRIALAAIAALAGGLLVAAPASAVPNETDYLASGNAAWTGATVAGPGNFVILQTTETATNPGMMGARVVISGSTILSVTDFTGDSITASQVSSTEAIVGNNDTMKISAAAAGTITATIYWATGVGTFSPTSEVATYVVGTPPAAVVYNHSTSDWIYYNGYADSANAAHVFVPQGSLNAQTQQAIFNVRQYSSTDTSTPMVSGSAKAVTVSVSGPALVANSITGYQGVQYLVFSAGGNYSHWIRVYSIGQSGTATITLAVNGVTVKTYTVTFYGAVASYALSISKAQIQANGVDEAVVTVVSKDANGIAVPNAIVNYGSDTPTVGFGSTFEYTPGTETFTVTGSAKGADVIYVNDGGSVAGSVVANFVTAGVATLAIATDKATYAPGEKMTFTLTAKNSDGVLAGDASYNIGSLSTSTSVFGLPAVGDAVAFKNGVGTFTAYAPVVQGPVLVTVGIGAGSATASTSVVDAAAVAQAAAIVALQTSVATLTTTVASLVASMTAQIKVINATMLKIQKALAALRLQVKKLK
jgi:hypothetical protein